MQDPFEFHEHRLYAVHPGCFVVGVQYPQVHQQFSEAGSDFRDVVAEEKVVEAGEIEVLVMQEEEMENFLHVVDSSYHDDDGD